MILPPPFAIITRPARCEHRNVLVRLISIISRQCESSIRPNGALPAAPALFTRIWIGPFCFTAAANAAATASGSRTSARIAGGDALREIAVTVAPSRASSAHTAAPIPRVPPVTTACWPLNGVPSIVIGVFAYGVAVLPFRQFSALAGGLALGIMMIPIIARTTEELLLLVPQTMREGALALGATRARAVFTVVVPAALPGIITGIVLALARIAGETAPLLFTSFNNPFFTTDLTQPIASLTVQIWAYAISPYEDWHRQAWAGALVLVMIVLVCSLLARFATRRLEQLSS